MKLSFRYLAFISATLTFCAVVIVSAQQQPAAGPFTAAQATAGQTAYQASCAGCHGNDLGGGSAPALSGAPFQGAWGPRSTRDLLGTIQGSMPPGNPGGMPEQTYLNIVAFILQSNGSAAGAQPLTATTAVPVNTGRGAGGAPTDAQAAGGGAGGQRAGGARGAAPDADGGGRGGGGRGAAPAPTTGLTVSGQVKTSTRVNDEMLNNQPAGDW